MKVKLDLDINAPAEKVWQVLGQQFAEIDNWATIVEASRPLEMDEVPAEYQVATEAPVPGRVTKTPLAELREVLVSYSDAARELVFQGIDKPFFASFAQNHSKVSENGPDRSTVTFEIEMGIKGIFNLFSPLLSRRFHATYSRVQQDLKTFVETGQPAA